MAVPVLAVQPCFVSVPGLCLSSPSQLPPPTFSAALSLELGSLGQGVPETAHGPCVEPNLRVLMPSRVA